MVFNSSSQSVVNSAHPASSLSRPAKALAEKLSELGGLFNKPPRRILLAYSGGLDSSVLLHLLYQLKTAGILDLAVAYYDHGWRGAPPPELATLHKQCHALGLSLILLTGNRLTPKTEAAAREVRYTGLLKLARQLQVDAIVTAHHADDQVETILFRLLRGTGIDGLKGIQPRWVPEMAENTDLPVLRPLLDWPRKQLYDYATQHQLRWFEDPTNQDTQFSRNAIRQKLLPVLDEHFPTARLSLLRLSQVLGSDAEIVLHTIENIWQSVYQPKTRGLARGPFNALEDACQRRILKRFLEQHGIESTWSLVDRALHFIQGSQVANTNRPQLFSLPSAAPTAETPDGNLNRRYLATYNVLADGSGLEIQPEIRIITLAKKMLFSPRLLPPVQPVMKVLWPVMRPQHLPSFVLPQASFAAGEDCLTGEPETVLVAEETAPSTPPPEITESETPGPQERELSPVVLEPSTPNAATQYSVNTYAPALRKTLVLSECVPDSGEAAIRNKTQLSLSSEDGVENVWVDLSALEKILAHEGSEKQLILRTRQPGDRFQPLGMQETVSLKSFLINRKLPHHQRANRLLLVLSPKNTTQPGEVLWIPGIELSDRLKVSANDAGQYLSTHQLTLRAMTLDEQLTHVPAFNVRPLPNQEGLTEDKTGLMRKQPGRVNASAIEASFLQEGLEDDFEAEALLNALFPTPDPVFESVEVAEPPYLQEMLPTTPLESLAPVPIEPDEQARPNPETPKTEEDAVPEFAPQVLEKPLKPAPAGDNTLVHLLGL